MTIFHFLISYWYYQHLDSHSCIPNIPSWNFFFFLSISHFFIMYISFSNNKESKLKEKNKTAFIYLIYLNSMRLLFLSFTFMHIIMKFCKIYGDLVVQIVVCRERSESPSKNDCPTNKINPINYHCYYFIPNMSIIFVFNGLDT